MTCLYYLQFGFMKHLVKHYNNREWDNLLVFTSVQDWRYSFKPEFNEAFGDRWDQISLEQEEENGIIYLTYTFPEPEVEPESKYAIIAINQQAHHADYYTLEAGGKGWFVCGNTEFGHLNYGTLDKTDNVKEAFIRRIKSLKMIE